MPAGPLLLCAVLRLAEGPVTTYEVGAASEARGQLQDQRGAWARLLELEVDPRLALNVDTLTTGFSAGYAPRLWYTSKTSGLQSLHRAVVQGSFKPDPLYRFTAAAAGATGMSNLLAPRLAALGGTTPGPIQTVGVQTEVRYVFADLSAGVDATPTARTRVAVNGAYQVDGGGDRAAQVSLPLQRGPRGALAFDWRLTADDQLAGEVLASRRTFTTTGVNPLTNQPLVMPPVWITSLTETWRRAFDKEFSTWLGGGASVSGKEAAAARPATATTAATDASPSSVTTAPVLDGGLQYVEEGGQNRLRLTARFGPIIDAVNGRVYQRADSVLTVSWATSRSWRVVGDLAGGLAIGGVDRGQKVVSIDARMAYALSRELEVNGGARIYWQEPGAQSTAVSYRLWGLFVGLTWLHRDLL